MLKNLLMNHISYRVSPQKVNEQIGTIHDSKKLMEVHKSELTFTYILLQVVVIFLN